VDGSEAASSGTTPKPINLIFAIYHVPTTVLDGLVVMIRLSHSRERGSIPRRGKLLFAPVSCPSFCRHQRIRPNARFNCVKICKVHVWQRRLQQVDK
jgi:hypothetical protein